MKKNTGRPRKVLSLYRLAFEEVVSSLRKAKPADTSKKVAQRADTRPKKARKGPSRKG